MPTLDAGSIDAVVTDPPYGLGFMGKAWDHGVPGPEFWRETLRVAKPGAFLCAFGGTRTYHRLTCAVEDAGWEIRDCLTWLYGTGFPKSHDVSKAIDKEAGARRERLRNVRSGVTRNAFARDAWSKEFKDSVLSSEPITEDAARFVGVGTALKPGWEPIVLARKPLGGTVAANALKHGTGGLNIDECRLPTNGERLDGGQVSTKTDGWDRPWKHDPEAVAACRERGAANVAKAERLGRWPANVVLSHDPACNGECVEGCPVRMLGEQSGERRSGEPGVRRKPSSYFQGIARTGEKETGHADAGTAARFFYTPKASPSERGEHNTHPTVKPLRIVEWLVKLVCPPGGLVLDPFAGSGTTAVACLNTGRRCVGIEREPEYFDVACRRVRAARDATPLLTG